MWRVCLPGKIYLSIYVKGLLPGKIYLYGETIPFPLPFLLFSSENSFLASLSPVLPHMFMRIEIRFYTIFGVITIYIRLKSTWNFPYLFVADLLLFVCVSPALQVSWLSDMTSIACNAPSFDDGEFNIDYFCLI